MILAEDRIKNTFPLKINEITYYLDKITRDENNVPYIEYHDNDGFKYHSNWRIFQYNTVNIGKIPGRYFKNNIYTKDNINNYLKLKNINLELIDDIPINNGANYFYKYIDFKGDIHEIKWCNLKEHPERYTDEFLSIKELTKDDVIAEIFRRQAELDRPIIEKDFRLNAGSNITQYDIKRFFGDFESMQQELGMLTARDRERVFITFSDCMDEIRQVCEDVYKNENRTQIRSDDFKKYSKSNKDSHLFAAYCRRNNTTLAKAVKSLGFGFQITKGFGLNYEFDDGEITYSSAEYDFSLFLRNNNIEYDREVLYSSFIPNYDGNMNCDYVLNIGNHKRYVEIAGVIGDFKESYLNNEFTNNEIRDGYFIKMWEKEKMLSQNNLDYYILFKSDINECKFNEIIH